MIKVMCMHVHLHVMYYKINMGYIQCTMYLQEYYLVTGMYMTLIIHEMLRKKGKATQNKRKTKQHNTTRPRQLFFKKKLPRVGLEPTTVSLLHLWKYGNFFQCVFVTLLADGLPPSRIANTIQSTQKEILSSPSHTKMTQTQNTTHHTTW